MKDTRSFNVDDLSHAVGEYNHARGKWAEAARMVATKRSEMESFEREEAKLKTDMDRHAANIRKIAKEL